MTMWLLFAEFEYVKNRLVRHYVYPGVITMTLWLVSVFGQSPFVCVIVGIIITDTFGPVLIAWLPY